jgi:hypothetical protein
MLTVHVVVAANVVDYEDVLQEVHDVLCREFGIHHATVQVEGGLVHGHCEPAMCVQAEAEVENDWEEMV